MEESLTRRPGNRHLILLGVVFAAVVTMLSLGYFLFLRTEYIVLVQDLRAADASAIVAELDKRGKTYKLRDGGATILVPNTEADATRVAIAGSDAAARGQIGFELFNKSDMGLTNFAQKINYQRALQGELVRTITAMDGVDTARVHLALPERTLFRGDRQEPRAAVTVAMKPGQVADSARVAGIQRLVAAAVPELPEKAVVILDSAGRIISAAMTSEPMSDGSPETEEKAALERYYRARARGAVERRLPGLKFTLRVLSLPIGEEPATGGSAVQWLPSGEGANRNFRLRMIMVTEAALGPEDRAGVRDAITQAATLDTALGDDLAFETGPVDAVFISVPAPTVPASGPIVGETPAPQRIAAPALLPGGWPWLLAALPVVALLIWRLRRRSAPALATEDHEAFAARLRRQLNLEGDTDAVA